MTQTLNEENEDIQTEEACGQKSEMKNIIFLFYII